MHFRDLIANSIYQRDWVTMIMVQNKYVFQRKTSSLYMIFIFSFWSRNGLFKMYRVMCVRVKSRNLLNEIV